MIFGEDVCCSLVFGTLVGVFESKIMWSELLLTSAISYPLWSSVYKSKRGCVLWCGLSVVCLCCAVCSVVCPCQLFCSAGMCCLEEVYRCLQL